MEKKDKGGSNEGSKEVTISFFNELDILFMFRESKKSLKTTPRGSFLV